MTHSPSILTTIGLFVFGTVFLAALPPLGIVLLILAVVSSWRTIRLERELYAEHRQERHDRRLRDMILAAKSLP